MKISAVTITNFKRIHEVRIAPDADRTILLLGGKNAAGKSSTLDALNAAFGGKRAQPSDPVRHGADEAEILVELDGGELTVRRLIQADGESALEVRDRMGAIRSPQAMLDRLVGARFLDPLAFLQLPAKEQRAQLMKMIEGADRIAGLDEKRGRAFSKRTEVGRDLTKAEGELARLPVVEVGKSIDVAELTSELKHQDAISAERAAADRTREQCERDTTSAKGQLARVVEERRRLEEELERLKARVVELGMKSAEWAEDVKKCEQVEADATAKVDALAEKWFDLQPRRAALNEDLARAGNLNRAVYAAEEHMRRRAEAADTVEKLTKERDDLTRVIETIDTRKTEILGAARLPVEGLSVDDEGITLGGVPFVQASGAERLRVALALAMAASPELDDVWIRDGALCDEDTLAAIADHAAAAKKRVWIERVGTADPGAIIIHDGRVAS